MLFRSEIRLRGAEPVSLEDLVRESDVVSLHCPRDATTMNLFDASMWDPTNLTLVFEVFVVTVITHIALNVFGARIIHFLQTINVYWHVVGVAAIVLILILIPDGHQSASFVFTERINNSGFGEGWYWFLVLPLGFLLTQYTITGFDASAHVSEETGGAAKAAAQGLWQIGRAHV